MAVLSRGPLWVLRHKRPLRTIGDARHADKEHVRAESIDLPLSRDGATVDRIMIVVVYGDG